MGTVFRARDRVAGGPVALKVVEGDHANARFEREAQLLARLTHPSIVRYVAHGPLVESRMYLAMEWLDGLSLDERLATAPLSFEESIALAKTVAVALDAAHQAGIVHRDIKPSNVFLRGGNPREPVLVDFGIARASKATYAMTATGAVIGTPAYMAPEQARGDKNVDARADVFSLGCVLFECLAGRPAFVGEHVIAVLAKILLEPAPRLSSLRADVPPALDALVAAMLAKTAAERPPSASAVLAALDAVGEGGARSNETNASTSGSRMSAIGATERRFVTVLLASAPAQVAAVAATVESAEDLLSGVTAEATVLDVGSDLGITISPLPNGMFVGAVVAAEGARDAADRVVRCAMKLATRVPRVAIAIATGRAIVADQVPVGEVIDLAARLLAARRAKSGIVLDDPTKSIVEAAFELRPEGDVFVVDRERDAAARGRMVLGRVVPFVGRDRELALLEATLRECIDEPVARAALVIAPPGTGKTRLARELVARATASLEPPPRIWTGLAQPATERTPFALAGDLFRRALGIVEDEPLERRREKTRRRVTEVLTGTGAISRVAGFLGELIGAPFEDDDPAIRAAHRNPELARPQIEEAVLAFVAAELAKQPLLLVLEDVHWADAASLKLFGILLAKAREQPLMVLALARPTVDQAHPGLWNDLRCARVALEPLLRKASEKLARAVLGDHPEIDAIVRRAEGNALFVEELARACAEGKSARDLPPTVAAATEARLASMPADLRQVLRAAAVFGERFWSGGVAHLLGGASDVATRIAGLEKLEVVSSAQESRFAGERELLFRHALVRDAAYAMLTDGDRALGHALAGEWLSERVDDAAMLADHYERGGRALEAARCHVHAAEQALLGHELDAVFAHAARAEELGAEPADLGLARAAEADASLWRGDNDGATRQALAAMQLLPRGSEKWFRAVGVGAAAAGKRGDRPSFDRLASALESTPAKGPREGCARAIARARAAIQYAYVGDLEHADALLDGCDQEPGAADDIEVKSWLLAAMTDRGNAAGEPVHPDVARRARELALSVGDRRGAFGLWAAELQIFLMVGDFEAAEASADALLRASDGTSWFITAYAGASRAMSAASKGDLEPLVAFARSLRGSGSPRFASAFCATSAQYLARAGRWEEAKANAEESLLAPEAASTVIGHSLLARYAVRSGDLETARRHIVAAEESSKLGVIAPAGPIRELAKADLFEAEGARSEATKVLRHGIEQLLHRLRHVRELHAAAFRAYDVPELFARAREHGIPTP